MYGTLVAFSGTSLVDRQQGRHARERAELAQLRRRDLHFDAVQRRLELGQDLSAL